MRAMIYGTGRLARQALHLLDTYFRGSCTVAGFVSDDRPAGEPVIDGYRVLGDLDTVARFPATAPDRVCLVAALEPDDPPRRRERLLRAQDRGFRFPVLIHPSAVVEPGTQLGTGIVIGALSVIDRGVAVGDFCCLEPGVKVGAGTQLGRNNHLAAGVTLGRRVHLGCDNLLGVNGTVADGVHLGDGRIIAAGALVEIDPLRQDLTAYPDQPDAAVVFDEVSHA